MLLRSQDGHTLGGYAGTSWKGLWLGVLGPCPDAFLFSVMGPYANIVKFPVKKESQQVALNQNSTTGPVFNGGLRVGSLRQRYSIFDCYCSIGECYEDVLGKGKATFTGAANGHFGLVEIEVYAVRA